VVRLNATVPTWVVYGIRGLSAPLVTCWWPTARLTGPRGSKTQWAFQYPEGAEEVKRDPNTS